VGPKTTELVAVLDELAAFLRRHSEAHWASWIERDRQALAAGDFHGVTHLLGAYGGMGSFNDLMLHPVNGHELDPSEIVSANERLDELRGRAYTLAHAIRRAADVTSP
jgi:hypothetical protein